MRNKLFVRDSFLIQLGEVLQCGQYRIGRRLAQTAAAQQLDGLPQILQLRQIRGGTPAGNNLIQFLRQQSGTDPAGDTPAAGFLRKELCKIVGRRWTGWRYGSSGQARNEEAYP